MPERAGWLIGRKIMANRPEFFGVLNKFNG